MRNQSVMTSFGQKNVKKAKAVGNKLAQITRWGQEGGSLLSPAKSKPKQEINRNQANGRQVGGAGRGMGSLIGDRVQGAASAARVTAPGLVKKGRKSGGR